MIGAEVLHDDLRHPYRFDRPPRRLVSLVPSLTEAVAVTVPVRLVGATRLGTHLADLDVVRARGTKNPERAAIAALAPDLVIVNREENREIGVARLRAAGIPVWVTVIESLDQALESTRRFFVEVVAMAEPEWLATANTPGRSRTPARVCGW